MYTQHFWLNSPQQKKHAAVFTANSFRKKQRNWQRIVNPARALRQMDSEVRAVLMVSGETSYPVTRGGLAPSLFEGVKQHFFLDENRTRKEETDLDDLFNSNSRSWNGIPLFLGDTEIHFQDDSDRDNKSKLAPFTASQILQVVQMIINMYYGGADACGSFTTGGTELGHPGRVSCGLIIYDFKKFFRKGDDSTFGYI